MDKFSLNSDPTIVNVDGRAVAKQYQKVYPTANRTQGNFASNVVFEFQNSAKQYFVPCESYFQIRLKLVGLSGTTEVLLRDASGIWPAFNIGSQFFSVYSHNINGTIVDRADQLSACDTAVKRLLLADEARKTWGQVSCLEPNRTTRLLNSGFDISGYNAGAGQNDIIWRPSLGLFATDQLIPPTCRHTLELVVDPNWKKKVIEATREMNPGDSGTYNVSVEEIVFYACMMSADVPAPNGNHYIQFSASEVNFQALTSATNNLTYTLKPSTNKISTFVQSSLAGTNTLYSSGIFDGSGIALKQSLNQTLVPRQSFGSSVQPSPDIDLTSTSLGTAGGSQYNWRRAFFDYIQTQGWDDETGNEDYKDWVALGPIFSYKHLRSPDDQSSTLQVYSTYTAKPENLNLYVYSTYDRMLNLQYNNGVCVAVQVEDL